MFNFVHVYLKEGSSASYSNEIRSEAAFRYSKGATKLANIPGPTPISH